MSSSPDGFAAISSAPPLSTDKKGRCASVCQILHAVREMRRGRYSSPPWQRFPLSKYEYAELLVEVDKEPKSIQGYWGDKLKCDYFPSNSTFVLRVPAGLHTCFMARVVEEVHRQLREPASGDSFTSDFARQIHCEGSTTMWFDEDYGRHDPDSSFGHYRGQYPGVMFEVSYPKKRRDLRRLAYDYIRGSDGNIRAVVGLNVEPPSNGKEEDAPSKLATISVWKPKITVEGDVEVQSVYQEVVDMVFRDKDGVANPSPDAGLSLRLDDFATTALHDHGPMPEMFFIPATTLTKFLDSAEKQDKMIREGRGVKQVSGKGIIKVRRQSTPEEEAEH